MLLPTMAPKCLPLELLFEFVPFIPAQNATPNALSSCWLLHKLLLPRVIKWQEIKMQAENQIIWLEKYPRYFRISWNGWFDNQRISRYEAFAKQLSGADDWARIGSVQARNSLEPYSVTFPVDEPSNEEYTFKIVAIDARGEELCTLPFVTGRLLP
ncbi:hypothetical protein niasHS_010394 [Heterodera schachtii]|uniref:Uncharacterized protein n=1 Tax=Heterodera schachtii TaxID=97005 RepID=A0ABD2J4E6_HETSC